MMNSTRNASAWQAATDPVNGFCSPSSVWCPDFPPVNGKKAHCRGAIPVNGNSPLTGRLLVTTCRRRSQLLSPVTGPARNGGGYE